MAGFFATETDTYYVTPKGQVWLVGGESDGPAMREALPADAAACGDLMTAEEMGEAVEAIQAVTDEVLIEAE
jgi:hypothetical protein